MALKIKDLCCGRSAVYRHSIWPILVLACFSLISNTAEAGRPLTTEDAAVLGVQQCEIESYGARRQGTASTYMSGQLGCGVGSQTQLAIGTASETDSTSSQLALTGKTSLIDLAAQSAGLAIAYAVVWQKKPHEYMRHQSVEAKAVITVPLDDYLVHANAGWIAMHTDHQDRLTWNAAIERTNALDRVDLMMELFGDNRTAPCLEFAARWTVMPARFFIDGAWGIRANSQKDKQASLGIRFAF